MFRLRSLLVLPVVLFAGWMPGEVRGEEVSKPTSDVKAQVLKWLDDYRRVQVLFSDDDVKRLREEIAESTDENAKAWWERTQKTRAALDSEEWKKTRTWLNEFLEVQAIYSDEEIEQFRQEAEAAAKDSPTRFKEILAEVEKKRTTLVRGATSSEQLREQKVGIARAYQKEQVAQRNAARRKTPSVAGAGANQSTSPAPRQSGYKPPGPLVTSLDAARWTVARSFWHR